MKRKIVYFEVCEKIEAYKKINLYQIIKNIKDNQIIKDMKYNIKILKLKIMSKFNLIQKVEDEEKITYIIYTDKHEEEKIIKKIEPFINKNKEEIIVLSKQIKQMWAYINNKKNNSKNAQKQLFKSNNKTNKKESKIERIIKYYENSKHLYNNYIQQILNNIIIIREEVPEEQSIYILIKSSNIQYIKQMMRMLSNYKMINIVTPNINNFKRLEDNLENSLETITILNNKRKSLSRAKYIINIDFSMEEIESYNINRTAIIFNLFDTELKNLKNFDGIIIKNVQIQNEEQAKYNLQDEYTANILNKQEIRLELNNKIKETIQKQQINLIGNNGIINFKQLKI